MKIDDESHKADKTAGFNIKQDDPQKSSVSGDTNTSMEIIEKNSDFLMKEYGESLKQRNIWLIQLIVISGSVFGGFALMQQQENETIDIGLGILFAVISFGLIGTYIENKKQINLIKKVSRKNLDYGFKVMLYQDLSEKGSLTKKEQQRKQQLEEYFRDFVRDTGLIKEDGTLGNVYDKSFTDRRFDWNYLLIIGFFLSILIIIFPDFFGETFGSIWDTLSSIFQQDALEAGSNIST